MKTALAFVLVVLVVLVAWYAVRESAIGEKLAIEWQRGKAQFTRSPRDVGKLAALEVKASDVVPEPARPVGVVGVGATVAETTDAYGRDRNHQRAAIAATTAYRAALELGMSEAEAFESRDYAVREFGFSHAGHVTLVLTGRTDWARAIEVMALAVAAVITSAATGGAAGVVGVLGTGIGGAVVGSGG